MKPNFSGWWRFNRTRSQLGMPAPDEAMVSVKHRDPVFELTRMHVAGGNTDTLTLHLRTDGSETTWEASGLSCRGWVRWDGDELEFDAIVRRGEHTGRNTVRYRLPDPNVLLADEHYRSDDTNYDNAWWFDRVTTPFVRDHGAVGGQSDRRTSSRVRRRTASRQREGSAAETGTPRHGRRPRRRRP